MHIDAAPREAEGQAHHDHVPEHGGSDRLRQSEVDVLMCKELLIWLLLLLEDDCD